MVQPRKKQEMTEKFKVRKAQVGQRVRSKVSALYMALAVVSCVCLVASNIFVSKRLVWGFTCGLLLFPIVYIIGDVTTEVYGFKAARRMIFMGFFMNFVVVLTGALAAVLPGVDGDPSTAAIDVIFHIDGGMAMVVLGASMISYVVGSLANAKVMQVMRRRDGERRFSLRAIVSTLVGESADSLIFFPVAFMGQVMEGLMTWGDLGYMVLLQVTFKTLYEIVVLPVTLRVVKTVKRIEEQP